MKPRVVSQPLAGNPLAEAVIGGIAPDGWYERLPADVTGWRGRLDSIRSSFDKDWLSRLEPAFGATGNAKTRLEASANGRGVVVTTGQQPGLFGGPVYTLSKALSVLAFADALQQATQIPVAPVFWAATDDTDFREASSTTVSIPGGAQVLRMDHPEALGRPMSVMPLPDLSAELAALDQATGQTVDREPLEILRQAYARGATVGSAYISLLRRLLAPLGISVVDASDVSLRTAARGILSAALDRSSQIAQGIKARSAELEATGYAPQVADVPGLSLVFSTASGSRKRIPIKTAQKQTVTEDMGPNVLLRPIVERAVLPTVVYIGGPAEIAYFAQITPIADALEVARPAVLPRWSCTILEPHVEKILDTLHLTPQDFRDPHEVEARIARSHLPKRVLEELQRTRLVVEAQLDALSRAVVEEKAPVAPTVTGGLHANLLRRLDRFERRLVAGAKREHSAIMRDLATARGSLYPFGKAQERSVNFIPFLARYGSNLRTAMMAEATKHATTFVGSGSTRDAGERMPASGRA
ncbi:MAG TPA: bacillithiol biosynthesis BshC [Gemmatimonadaceae bacterium]|nr:bacillithiol biosynthesis BshC [Gemmatimonadaceae bacterium]